MSTLEQVLQFVIALVGLVGVGLLLFLVQRYFGWKAALGAVTAIAAALGLTWLWRILQPPPARPRAPSLPPPFDEAERERVKATIEKHQEAAATARHEVEDAAAAPTADEASERLQALARGEKPPRPRVVPAPDATPTTDPKRRRHGKPS